MTEYLKVLSRTLIHNEHSSLALIVSSSLQVPPFEGCIYFLERKAKQNKIHHFDVRPSASAHDLGPKHSCLCRTQLLF